MAIRKLGNVDIQKAAEILYNSWHNAFAPHLEQDIIEGITLESCVRNLEKSMNDPDSTLKHTGFYKDSILVGTLSMGPSRFGDSSTVEVWSMHVVKDEQRSGIGSRLLLSALGSARKSGYLKLHLTCIAANAQALAFYQKHGGLIQEGVINRRGFEEIEISWTL